MSDIELELLAQAYREAAAAIKELEAQQEALRAKMIAELENRGAEEVEVEVGSEVGGCTIDTRLLKAVAPDIAAQYTKTSLVTRFQVT